MLALALLIGCSTELAPSDRGSASAPASGSSPVFAGSGAVSPRAGMGAVGPTAGAGAANAGAAGPSVGSASTTLNLAGAPEYTRFVRLTNEQWAQSVQDILRLPSPSAVESNFQAAVAGTTDFTNNELVLDVDQRAASDFQSAAESLATMVTASSDALARVYPGSDAAGFIATLGRRAYRRPLTTSEQAAYLALFNHAATLTGAQSTFAKGAGLIIRAMLQSPFFLYRTELGADGTPLSGYELATKLSLWLRGTTPSDTLLDTAAQGMFDSADGATAIATTLMAEPTALAVMRDFHDQLYHFERYATISKIGVSDYDPSLNDEFLESSTQSSLAAMTDKATSVLAPHASNLLFMKNINFPMNGPSGCGHAQGLCQRSWYGRPRARAVAALPAAPDKYRVQVARS
jgi:hypothetical protein